MVNKLTMNLLILLAIPCILYGRSFNVMDFGARGTESVMTQSPFRRLWMPVRMPEGEMWSFPPIIHFFQDPYS